MMRFFNNAGPCVPTQHYMIDPLKRLDLPEVLALIEQQCYFVLHAPRQTGKTTSLLALMDYLNKEERYRTLYVNIENAQTARGDVERGISTVCSVFSQSAEFYLNDDSLTQWLDSGGNDKPADNRFTMLLRQWASVDSRPTVLFLDEVDALVGDTLISLLRQIRSGYTQRPRAFPQSIILCGVRDVRDYRIRTKHQEIITGGSAFNIKAKSLPMGNFNPKEVRQLYQQHTHETGQIFDSSLFDEMGLDTGGQPWLVNTLGREMTWEDRSARHPATRITFERYSAAKERLIHSRATHLDQLVDKLKETRVHTVIAALLSGEQSELQVPHDDLQYIEDLGLIACKPQVRISNRIYQEIIPRELTAVTQYSIVQKQSWYLTAENRLNMPKLLSAFQQFFRENSESWIERFDYKEAGPQLLIQAFLQRIINSGGRINREYALGRKRTDLSIEWPVDPEEGFYGEVQKIIVELKIQRGVLETIIEKGLKQSSEYADKFGAREAYLVIFNRDPNIPWDKKIWKQNRQYANRIIGVWGM